MDKITFYLELETDVYANSGGGITIEQRDGVEEPQVIAFYSKKRALDVAKAIRKLALEMDDEPQS